MRKIVSIFIGSFATLVIFGIVLSILWAVGSEASSFKLISALTSALLAFVVGGFSIAWISRNQDLLLPMAFGLAFGGFAFGYILGLKLIVIGFAVVSGLAAYAGGLIYWNVFRLEHSVSDFDAG